LPMDLMVRPTIATSVVANFLLGGILFGLETYVPLFIQGVRGGNAQQAGQALTPLFLAWAVSVAFAARAVVRWGFRRAGMIGAGLVAMGMFGMVTGAMIPAWSRTAFTVSLAVIGTGMGPVSLSFILAVQQAVSWGQRGVATGAVIFFRTIGGAIGVGILGGALGWELGHLLISSGASGIDVGAALRPETHHLLSPESLALVQAKLGVSLRDVYIQMLILALGMLVCTAWLPGRSARSIAPPRSTSDPEPSESELVATISEA
jgi:MFS family permease